MTPRYAYGRISGIRKPTKKHRQNVCRRDFSFLPSDIYIEAEKIKSRAGSSLVTFGDPTRLSGKIQAYSQEAGKYITLLSDRISKYQDDIGFMGFFAPNKPSTQFDLFNNLNSSSKVGGYATIQIAHPQTVRTVFYYETTGSYAVVSQDMGTTITWGSWNFVAFSYRSSDGLFTFGLNGITKTLTQTGLGGIKNDDPKLFSITDNLGEYEKMGAITTSLDPYSESDMDGFFNKYRHLYGL